MRSGPVIRTVATGLLACGVAAPLVRRRLGLKPPVVLAVAASAPVALCVLVPRSRARDVGTVVLQMWAYLAAYEMPNDDPDALLARVRVRYPVAVDRRIGLGTVPTLRLQRALATPGRFAPWERTLVYLHWAWFLVPHGTAAFLLARHRERFPAGALQLYATFDLGLLGYWGVPTAPPWFAAAEGLLDDGKTPELRRMMVEHGEAVFGPGWQRLYGLLGGNPLAAMPSLHFAISVQAAHLLSDVGRGPGAVGWTYASALGFALVYLGEHYVVDLAAGLALAEAVRRLGPRAAPLLEAVSAQVQRLEAAGAR